MGKLKGPKAGATWRYYEPFGSSRIQYYGGHVCKKEKGQSASKCRMPIFPLAHVLNEDHVLPLDWMVDDPSLWI
jgi:hypothetical protein